MMGARSSHRHSTDELQALLDGALDAKQAADVESRVCRCRECRQELGALGAVDVALRSAPTVVEPPDFTQRVMARLPATPRPAFHIGLGDIALAVGLTVVFALVLLAMLATTMVVATGNGGRLVDLLDPTRLLESIVLSGISPLWLGLAQAAFWGTLGLLLSLALRSASHLWSAE